MGHIISIIPVPCLNGIYFEKSYYDNGIVPTCWHNQVISIYTATTSMAETKSNTTTSFTVEESVLGLLGTKVPNSPIHQSRCLQAYQFHFSMLAWGVFQTGITEQWHHNHASAGNWQQGQCKLKCLSSYNFIFRGRIHILTELSEIS